MKRFLRGLWGLVQIIIIVYVICITACLLCKNKYGFTQIGDMTLITINKELQTYLPETKKGDLLLVKETNLDMKVGDKIYYYSTANNEYVIKTAHIKEIVTSDGNISLYKLDDLKGSTIATNRVLGKYSTVYENIGSILDILESKIGFLLLVILPILLIFMYQVYALIIVIKYGDEETVEEEKTQHKKPTNKKREQEIELL